MPPQDREGAIAAIQSDPNAAANYAVLANMMDQEETLVVDGCPCGPKELLVKALELDPTLSEAYSDLGSILSLEEPGSTLHLQGRRWSEKALYVQALELDPRLAVTYENLGDCLEGEEVVSIGGHLYTGDDLRRKAAELEAQQGET